LSLRAGAVDRVRDQRIERIEPLVAPLTLLDELTLRDEQAQVVLHGRSEIHAILDGLDDRLLVVVGPCSVHDVDATLDYARRLSTEATRHWSDLCVTMRVYFEKPRTTTGWKGLINDPHLNGSGDVNTGLRMARGLLLKVLELGLPVGCEFLDPITPQYISDAVSWGAIGARTTESQIHRQLGSGSRTGPTATSRWRSTRCAPPPWRTPSPASTSTARRRSTTPAATAIATSSSAAAPTRPIIAPRRWRRRSICSARPGCPSGW
jgi:hypothetical protein